MGRSYTPPYTAQYRDQKGWHEIGWPHRKPPTAADAERMRQQLNRSFELNGANYHVSRDAGIILHVSELRVVRNRAGREIVARAIMPLFEVVA